MINLEILQKLKFSNTGFNEEFELPKPLRDSIILINDFFKNNTNNKLCLVFPSKEYAAQWISIPLTFNQIESDFLEFKNEINESLEKYKKGDWVILNNEAVVSWVGKNSNGFTFKHKEYNGVEEINISLKKISKIQPAPPSRKALSAYKRVKEALSNNQALPIDNLLDIQTEGNKLYQKKSICLISKHISYEKSTSGLKANGFCINDYFKTGKTDDNGDFDIKSGLLIATNLRNLALFLTQNQSISTIIIDSYTSIQEKSIDFNDIDAKRIPTILITDISEVSNFENIREYGFDFFNFSNEKLLPNKVHTESPFKAFDFKVANYLSFSLKRELCSDLELDSVSRLIHKIDKDDTVKELLNIKILLIQLCNNVSRISHPLKLKDRLYINDSISKIEEAFQTNRVYFGNSVNLIENIIAIFKTLVEKLTTHQTDKCVKLNELLKRNHYDLIICANDAEALVLTLHVKSLYLSHYPVIIPISDVNNDLLLRKSSKIILIGWVKSNNITRLLSSFVFSEITVLFYDFENRYLNSLQYRNKQILGNVKPTVDSSGFKISEHSACQTGFDDLYNVSVESTKSTEDVIDITAFELNLNNAQYSKYIIKDVQNGSIVKAKLVEFINDKFIYLTDTHSLLVLDNIDHPEGRQLSIHKHKIEDLHHADVIAFIKTERELLSKIVAKQTTPADLADTTKWIELWKGLLRSHYKSLNNNFTGLVKELQSHGCNRDQVTIRSWLFDDLRIGPRKDDDLLAIAVMTNGVELYNNIAQVRSSIKQMTSWRMKASDFVIEQLKQKIKRMAQTIKINSVIDFEDLGEIEILEVSEISPTYDNIDIKNVNRLLETLNM